VIHRLSVVLLLILSAAAAAETLYRWTDSSGGVHYSDLPPPADVKRLDIKEVGSGGFVETSGPSYALRKAQSSFPVTLYAAPDCAEECKSGREFLARRGIPYAEINVSTTDAAAQFKRVFGGEEVFVPSLTVGNQKLRGYEQTLWGRLLDDAGYPSANPAPPPRPAAPSPAAATSPP
jgi:glutaredoxin